MSTKSINPNGDKEFIDKLDITNEHNFPKFLLSIRLCPFRHIPDLQLDFVHPISVVAGTNRSGKSTILMALACSHFDFKKRNVHNGRLERHTWSSIMQFTNHDIQVADWTYYISYKFGKKEERKRGQRKLITGKWNGVGKKESQFKDRQVLFLDLDRILPARNFAKGTYYKARKATATDISAKNVERIEMCLSYILEQEIRLKKLANHLDKDVYKYSNANEYSSYNAATGEEVLTKIIIDVIETSPNSLILIDEIEVGLHPKVQRRLVDVLYYLAKSHNKQFIITTHSPTILSSVPEKARIFIEKRPNGTFKSIANVSVNAALSKMDSVAYPLVDLYCEDNEARKIILKVISSLTEERSLTNLSSLINIIVSGSHSKTYSHFISHSETYQHRKIKVGYACILDGDARNAKDNRGKLCYPAQPELHFLYSDEPPEIFLIREYLNVYPNETMIYHLNNSNPHCLFEKMIENSLGSTKDEIFEKCWKAFIDSENGKIYFEELKTFVLDRLRQFSPDL